MNYKIVLGIVLILSLLGTTNAQTVYLEFTETYNTTVINMVDDKLHINVPAGDYIDYIEIKPKFLVGDHEEYRINTTLYLNDQEYILSEHIETSLSILNLFSSNYDHRFELLVDSEQNFMKDRNHKVFTSCWFSTWIKYSFGNTANVLPEEIGIDTHITTNRGKIRYNENVDVYDVESYTCSNITIDKDNLDELEIIVGYRLESVKSKEYYVSLLSPTIGTIYTIAFQWLDQDNYLLNTFLVLDFTLVNVMFWVVVIGQNMGIIMFLVLILVIPILAYNKSRTQLDFFNVLISMYAHLLANLMYFVRYMIHLSLKGVEIVRSMVPWI